MPKEGRRGEKEGWVSSILFFVCCWFSVRFGATSPCRSLSFMGGKQAPKLTINRNFKCLFWPTIPMKRRGNTKAKQLAKVLRFGGGGPSLLSIAATAAGAKRVRRNGKKREKKSQSVFRETESCRQSRHRHKKERESPTAVHKTTTTAIRPGPATGPTTKQKSASPLRMLVVQNDFHQICRVSPYRI